MIYHITTQQQWTASEGKSDYAPDAFQKEGFIHTSRLNQLAGVLERYYAGRTDLLLLKIDEKKLDADLIYEPSATRELFPHIYGKINKDSIIAVVESFTTDSLNDLG